MNGLSVMGDLLLGMQFYVTDDYGVHVKLGTPAVEASFYFIFGA